MIQWTGENFWDVCAFVRNNLKFDKDDFALFLGTKKVPIGSYIVATDEGFDILDQASSPKS